MNKRTHKQSTVIRVSKFFSKSTTYSNIHQEQFHKKYSSQKYFHIGKMDRDYLKHLCSLLLDHGVIRRVHPSPYVSSPNPGWRDGKRYQSSTPEGIASSYHLLFVTTSNLTPSRLPLPWRWLISSVFVHLFPSDVIIFQHDAAGKPRVLTSTGKFHVCHPASLRSNSRSSYLAYFLSWASGHRVSHGTLSPMEHDSVTCTSDQQYGYRPKSNRSLGQRERFVGSKVGTTLRNDVGWTLFSSSAQRYCQQLVQSWSNVLSPKSHSCSQSVIKQLGTKTKLFS